MRPFHAPTCRLALTLAAVVPACAVDSTSTSTARAAVTTREPSREHGPPPVHPGQHPWALPAVDATSQVRSITESTAQVIMPAPYPGGR